MSGPEKIQKSEPTREQVTCDCSAQLQGAKTDLEANMTPNQKIERARIHFECYLKGQLNNEMKDEDGKYVDIDHYLLGLRDQIDFRLFDTTKYDGGKRLSFGMFQQRHEASIAYALVRSELSPDRKIDIGGGQTMTVLEFAQYHLQHIRNSDHYDSEWIALLTLSLALENKGNIPKLKGKNGKTWSLEEIMATNQAEFNYVYHKDPNSSDEIEVDTPDKPGNCEGLHALHALVLYDLLKNDISSLQEHAGFIFNRIENIDQAVFEALKRNNSRASSKEQKQYNELNMKIRLISHLLTPLTDILERRPDLLSLAQKAQLKNVIFSMTEDVPKLIELSKIPDEEGRTNESHNSSTIAHVVDVLNHTRSLWNVQ